jgi:membrane associated rhomboid family serine protease
MRSVTYALIALNVAVFLLQGSPGGDALVVRYALWPVGEWSLPDLEGARGGFQSWQLVTYAFLHGSPTHLFLNMFALWMFGRDVEGALGSARYALLYFAAVLTAGCVQLAVASAAGEPYPTVGASGGVFGLLLAFAMLFPRRRVLLLIPPIPMPAWLFVTLYGVVELANGVFGTQAGVAHFAHLGGMLGALAVLLAWRERPSAGAD